MGGRKAGWLIFIFRCLMTVSALWLFFIVAWFGLQFVIVVIPYHITYFFQDSSMAITIEIIIENKKKCISPE